jgi:hypothetical protein
MTAWRCAKPPFSWSVCASRVLALAHGAVWTAAVAITIASEAATTFTGWPSICACHPEELACRELGKAPPKNDRAKPR